MSSHRHRKEIEEIRSGCQQPGNRYRRLPENERRNPFPRVPEIRHQPSTDQTAMAPLRQAEASMPGSQTRTSMMNCCFQLMTRTTPVRISVELHLHRTAATGPLTSIKPERRAGYYRVATMFSRAKSSEFLNIYSTRKLAIGTSG